MRLVALVLFRVDVAVITGVGFGVVFRLISSEIYVKWRKTAQSVYEAIPGM